MHQNDRQLPDWSKDAYNGTNTLHDNYLYDPNGNNGAILDGAQASRADRTMAYDALDRLTSTASPMFGTTAAGTGTAVFKYDALDNLTQLTMPATDTTTARNQPA